jgi:hypothetical protein
MPFRAMFTTIVTVALALLTVGMWIRAVEPMLRAANAAATQPGRQVATTSATRTSSTVTPPPDRELRVVIKGTLLLSFFLICLLLVVGFLASFREWVRVHTMAKGSRKAARTRYVDAWKIAGERMNVEPQEPPDSSSSPDDPGDSK